VSPPGSRRAGPRAESRPHVEITTDRASVAQAVPAGARRHAGVLSAELIQRYGLTDWAVQVRRDFYVAPQVVTLAELWQARAFAADRLNSLQHPRYHRARARYSNRTHLLRRLIGEVSQ